MAIAAFAFDTALGDMNQSSPGLRIRSAKDAAADELRRLIDSGEFTPGERLSIEALAERFGLSRTPIRDALFILRSEGLVTVVPRIGVFVRNIGDTEAREVYRIKAGLEAIMASWAAERGSPAQKDAFMKSLTALKKAAGRGDTSQYVRLLEVRRERLAEMAASSVMDDVLQVINGRARLLRFGNMSDPQALLGSYAEHHRIASAIADGDPDAAYEAMTAHMTNAAARFRSIAERNSSDEHENG